MKIGIIGVGHMGSALVRGLVKANIVKNDKIIASDLDEKKLEKLSKLGVRTTNNNKEVIENSKVIFLAVKPSNMEEVLEDLDLSSDKLLVSIAAGVPIDMIEKYTEAKVVRLMPNICADVSELASAYSPGKRIEKDDKEIVENILDQMGSTIEVEESLMDAVTGLSGSGPAFVFMVIQALKEAGEELGMAGEDARKLAAQTLKGGSEMVLESSDSLDDLIDSVCSPGGTTIEGLKVLRAKEVQKTLKEAVIASAEKSKKLSK